MFPVNGFGGGFSGLVEKARFFRDAIPGKTRFLYANVFWELKVRCMNSKIKVKKRGMPAG